MKQKTLMVTEGVMIKQKKVLPPVLPHGWKKEVAGLLGVHINTITKHLKLGKGLTYDKIIHLAKEKYGIVEHNKD